MKSLQVKRLNKSLSVAHNDARLAHILNTHRGKTLITTSFGTTSALLLHMVSRIRPDHPVHFVNTGYLFPETIDYINELTKRFDLNVIEHQPVPKEHAITKENKTWEDNPDLCCYYNKVKLVNEIKKGYDVWISGLIGYQNSYRSGLDILQERKDIYRFYPLIDWAKEEVEEYFDNYSLPRHPLERFGYHSIGCTHCTQKGSGRDGRWDNSSKSECGLHT
ncbi:MAG: phosphoadenylyl-sulfate reductase [Balneolaceae bacterium]|nr:phosphoadenylyl-sulfate reductase [Balneolaceae bacterium]